MARSGEGGVGRPFADGEVLLTFPHIEDQLRFVYFGTAEYNLAGVSDYGNPDREGGPHLTGSFGVMPPQGEAAGGDLTDAEILAVVCHERYTLGGADPTAEETVEEFETWCSEEAPTFVALEEGTTLAELADAGLTNADGRGDRDRADRRRASARIATGVTVQLWRRNGRPDRRGRAGRRRRARTGWPATATTSRWSRSGGSRARRRAATG